MKISKQEYKELQELLSNKISPSALLNLKIGWNVFISPKEKEAYREGVLAAKSIIDSFYSQRNKDEDE